MSNETSVSPAHDAVPSTGSSRRAVLRAGAHAAWAVPAVQVATMVPAFATSGSHAEFTAPGGALTVANGSGNERVQGTLLVTETKGFASGTVTLTLGGYQVGSPLATPSGTIAYGVSGGGWTRVVVGGVPTNSWTRVFAASGSSTATVSAQSTTKANGVPASLSVTLTYSGSDHGPGSATFAK